jgi:N,N-dimethylformamidase
VLPASRDPRAAFVFEGVGQGIVGDFGMLQGGAAGYEIDRADPALGTPGHALVLASSEQHSNIYEVSASSFMDLVPSQDESAPQPLRADMVFFETPGGGAVFSVGSIAWCGSLAHDGYANDVARITGNVLRRFCDPAPFAMPGAPSR